MEPPSKIGKNALSAERTPEEIAEIASLMNVGEAQIRRWSQAGLLSNDVVVGLKDILEERNHTD